MTVKYRFTLAATLFASNYTVVYCCVIVVVCVQFFRWEEYDALGEPVAGTRFISFKVPLKEVSFITVLSVSSSDMAVHKLPASCYESITF